MPFFNERAVALIVNEPNYTLTRKFNTDIREILIIQNHLKRIIIRKLF